jgi:glutaredoxin
MSEQIIVYTKQPDETGHCPFCISAVDYLTNKGLSFKEVVLNREGRRKLYDEFGLEGSKRTVPQVVIEQDGEKMRIGGYSELIQSGIASLA